jgi:hypothetical protein
MHFFVARSVLQSYIAPSGRFKTSAEVLPPKRTFHRLWSDLAWSRWTDILSKGKLVFEKLNVANLAFQDYAFV